MLDWREVYSTPKEKLEVVSLGQVGLLKLTSVKGNISTPISITTINEQTLNILLIEAKLNTAKLNTAKKLQEKN